MTTLGQLESDLRASGKFWMFDSRVAGKTLTDDQKIAVAQQVLVAGKPWAQGLAEEIAARQYPPGYAEDEDQ